MGDFKVGDKVRIKSIEEIRKIDKSLNGIDEEVLKGMQGKIYTISYVDKNSQECELLYVLIEYKDYFSFKSDFLVKIENYYKDLPDTYSGKLVIEKGQVIEKEEKKEILDEVEKEYLKAVIKPFRGKIVSISKEGSRCYGEYINIVLADENITFPFFKDGTMYKGMKQGKRYNLQELGL